MPAFSLLQLTVVSLGLCLPLAHASEVVSGYVTRAGTPEIYFVNEIEVHCTPGKTQWLLHSPGQLTESRVECQPVAGGGTTDSERCAGQEEQDRHGRDSGRRQAHPAGGERLCHCGPNCEACRPGRRHAPRGWVSAAHHSADKGLVCGRLFVEYGHPGHERVGSLHGHAACRWCGGRGHASVQPKHRHGNRRQAAQENGVRCSIGIRERPAGRRKQILSWRKRKAHSRLR